MDPVPEAVFFCPRTYVAGFAGKRLNESVSGALHENVRVFVIDANGVDAAIALNLVNLNSHGTCSIFIFCLLLCPNYSTCGGLNQYLGGPFLYFVVSEASLRPIHHLCRRFLPSGTPPMREPPANARFTRGSASIRASCRAVWSRDTPDHRGQSSIVPDVRQICFLYCVLRAF
jgi:hypothetical protein